MQKINDEDIADKVSGLVLSYFKSPSTSLGDKNLKLFRNNKPKENKDEFTVLAGIVSITPVSSAQATNGIEPSNYPSKKRKVYPKIGPFEYTVLTISTGLKTIPVSRIEKQSRGRLIHDQHAEILSVRLFNYWLLKEIDNLKNASGYESKLIEEKSPGRYGLCNTETKFALYVSEIPCGDASISNVRSKSLSDAVWSYEEKENEVLRGRDNFSVTGKVRTKPGRRDSPLSLSKSCSDKLTILQFKGLLSSVTFNLIGDAYRNGFYLDYLNPSLYYLHIIHLILTVITAWAEGKPHKHPSFVLQVLGLFK
ncbi:unnamed protein product [Ambrosiozyma monospora]|uniref:Unnamed protein product n=1 Tax=Ambrosiozyma monospora TaxID=43982 RepID=A0ACB5SYD5_AMBMO|nr:unnamed protein product [Ambrosiozyma monospora]